MIGKLLNGGTRRFAERHGVVALLFLTFMGFTFFGGKEFISELRALRESGEKRLQEVVSALKEQTLELKVIREDQIKGRQEAVRQVIEEVRRKQ